MSTPSNDAPPDAQLGVRDLVHLRRCVALAATALEHGHEPFGSVLVDGDGVVLTEDHNRDRPGDATAHPELALALWADRHVDPVERAACTVYTSGEHCPMCAAAHAWVGLGRIVYACSAQQLVSWRDRWGAPPSPVAALPIQQVAPGLEVGGPASELWPELQRLHRRSLETQRSR